MKTPSTSSWTPRTQPQPTATTAPPPASSWKPNSQAPPPAPQVQPPLQEAATPPDNVD
jgi:hypothetical protein